MTRLESQDYARELLKDWRTPIRRSSWRRRFVGMGGVSCRNWTLSVRWQFP
ncbi:MAG: hypothetical protein MI923_23960 [Phycisphaerales bacterium]|nr:hypothetical protein [Phycisphaerales bacterium]